MNLTMKFATLALLACSLSCTSAYQPNLRLSEKDEVESCFEKCGKKGDEKEDKVVECQNECVSTATTSGRSRSSIGPAGADSLLLCGAECAEDEAETYKKESKDADEKGCKKSCPEDDDGSCEKACKDEAKQIEKDAASKASKDYKKCNEKCFKEESFLASAFKVYLQSSEDDIEKCFKNCGKKADKASKVEECQAECVTESVATGRSRSSIGPSGANDLLICGSNCAEDGEKKYKKAAKDSDAKGCKKSCPEDDDGSCEKACKSLEKEAKKDAEKAATKEYESCNKKCFKEDSLISAFKFYLGSSGEDTLEECTEKCGKEAKKSEKVIECQNDCYAQYPSARSATLATCNTECAEEAEDTYDKEMKDSDSKDCKKDCADDDEDCEDACKDAEKEAEKDAEHKAESDYKKCNAKCYETGSYFKIGYVA